MERIQIIFLVLLFFIGVLDKHLSVSFLTYELIWTKIMFLDSTELKSKVSVKTKRGFFFLILQITFSILSLLLLSINLIILCIKLDKNMYFNVFVYCQLSQWVNITKTDLIKSISINSRDDFQNIFVVRVAAMKRKFALFFPVNEEIFLLVRGWNFYIETDKGVAAKLTPLSEPRHAQFHSLNVSHKRVSWRPYILLHNVFLLFPYTCR